MMIQRQRRWLEATTVGGNWGHGDAGKCHHQPYVGRPVGYWRSYCQMNSSKRRECSYSWDINQPFECSSRTGGYSCHKGGLRTDDDTSRRGEYKQQSPVWWGPSKEEGRKTTEPIKSTSVRPFFLWRWVHHWRQEEDETPAERRSIRDCVSCSSCCFTLTLSHVAACLLLFFHHFIIRYEQGDGNDGDRMSTLWRWPTSLSAVAVPCRAVHQHNLWEEEKRRDVFLFSCLVGLLVRMWQGRHRHSRWGERGGHKMEANESRRRRRPINFLLLLLLVLPCHPPMEFPMARGGRVSCRAVRL